VVDLRDGEGLRETSVKRKEHELHGSEGTGVGLQKDEIEIPVNCYPIESITRFELKTAIPRATSTSTCSAKSQRHHFYFHFEVAFCNILNCIN